VLEGLRGEESIAELCRREGIASSMYYGWSKEFLEAGKKRLAGDTARAATSDEVKDLCCEAQALQEAVADLKLKDWAFASRAGIPLLKAYGEPVGPAADSRRASNLSIRLRSISTISNRHPSYLKCSPTSGRCPSWARAKPAIV
jgi:hypothetical protein